MISYLDIMNAWFSYLNNDSDTEVPEVEKSTFSIIKLTGGEVKVVIDHNDNFAKNL